MHLGRTVGWGRVASLNLSHLYVDQLICELSNANIRCSIDGLYGQCVNNIGYTNDMVVYSGNYNLAQNVYFVECCSWKTVEYVEWFFNNTCWVVTCTFGSNVTPKSRLFLTFINITFLWTHRCKHYFVKSSVIWWIKNELYGFTFLTVSRLILLNKQSKIWF